MFELSIWSRWRVVNHPIPPSLPLALKLIHELIHGCDTSPSLLSLSFYLHRASSKFFNPSASRGSRPMPASLQRFLDDVVASGIGPSPPPPLSAKLARRLLQSGRKERSPALVVPRFDLIGLPTFSWQNRSCLRLRRWKRPAFPLLPAVWRRFRPAGHPPPSPSSSSSSGRKTFARWRTIESTERDLSASFQFSDVSPAPSAEIDVPPSLTDAGEEGGGSIAAGNRPESVPRRYCAGGPAFFFDTVMRMDSRDPRESWIPLSRG